MKGNAKVIQVLNDVLSAELVGINQYFLHAKMCRNWGYLRLGEHILHESLSEMKHASDLTERILFLEGIPNLQKLGKIAIGETVPEQLTLDRAVEVDAVKRLNAGIAVCTAAGDNASRHLLESILTGEEEHLDWIETQLALVASLGVKQYLAEQLRG
jgi:bacterioferritin